MVNAPVITITVASFSIILSILSIMIASCLVYNFNSKEAKQKQQEQREKGSNSKYFEITSQTAAICNVGCCLSISMYCIWIIFESEQKLEWFIMLRALPTIFWFMAKASLIWLYNGRLYYTFQKGIFKSSYISFIVINILITIAAPICITMGYLGVWYNTYILISLGFEGYRFLYILLTFYLLIMFSKKMLKIQKDIIESDCMKYTRSRAHSDAEMTETEMIENQSQTSRNGYMKTRQGQDEEEQEETLCFLNVTTRNTVLVLFISMSACLVAFWWTAFDYILGQNYLTLLAPLNMFALDCIIDSCCIYLLFQCGKDVYERICGRCHNCCKELLFYICIHK